MHTCTAEPQELKTGFGQRGEVYFLAQAVAIVLIVLCPFQLAGLLDLAATLLLTTGLVFMCVRACMHARVCACVHACI